MPIRRRIAPLTPRRCLLGVSCGISRGFPRLYPCGGQVAYVLLTRAPVAGRRKQACAPAAPRLACVKPVASVHPEPGSNSPLLVYLFQDFLSLLLSFVPVRRAAPDSRFAGVSARPAGPDGKRCLCPDCLSRLYCLMDCRKLTGGSCYGHPSEGCPSFSCTVSSIANVSMFSRSCAPPVSGQPCEVTPYPRNGKIFNRL